MELSGNEPGGCAVARVAVTAAFLRMWQVKAALNTNLVEGFVPGRLDARSLV